MGLSAFELMLRRTHELVQAAGVFTEFETADRFALRLEREPYMPLVIASWPTPDPLQGERRRILLAHYVIEDGHAVPDPALEMTDCGFPIRLLQRVFGMMESRILWRDLVTHEVMVNPAAKRSLAGFLRSWAREIKRQDYLAAARGMGGSGVPSLIEEQLPWNQQGGGYGQG